MANRRWRTNTVARLIRLHKRCHWCGKFVVQNVKQHHPHKATADHIKPLSAGGYDKPCNIVLACYPCNHLRGNTPAEEWAAKAKTLLHLHKGFAR